MTAGEQAPQGQQQEKKKKKTLPDTLFDETKELFFFHDQRDMAYCRIEKNIIPVKSKIFSAFLTKTFMQIQHKIPNPATIKAVVDACVAEALFAEQIKLHNRCAWHNKELYYDLCNGNAIKVNKNGWEIVEPPILFRHYSHQKEQIEPNKSGDAKRILHFVRLGDSDDELLFLVDFITKYIPSIAKVISIFYGEQGSTKTSICRIIKSLIDPSKVTELSFPKDKTEFIQQLDHHYFITYDNVSYLSNEQSDQLCRAITGSGHSKRELYTDDEDIIYQFKRGISINGINITAKNPDLLDRGALYNIPKIEEKDRVDERQLKFDFDKEKPAILCGIFNALSGAMKIYDVVKKDLQGKLPRMADFAIWGEAISRTLGYKPNEFIKAYEMNRSKQDYEIINNDVVGIAILEWMSDIKDWKGTPTTLYNGLKQTFKDLSSGSKNYPTDPARLSKKLNRLKQSFRKIGIDIVSYTEKNKNWIRITNENYIKPATTQDILRFV